MSKFQRSWVLFKKSLSVVGSNRKLLLFPIVTTIMIGLIGVFFLAPLAFWNTGHGLTDAGHWKTIGSYFFTTVDGGEEISINPAGYIVAIIVYFISVFLATFFNVAFFNEILKALKGHPVSIRGGLKFATTRLKAILLWSLFTGAIGLLIKMLEERVGLIGKLVLRFIGIAWSVACIFVVPAIVCNETQINPVRFLKDSASALKKTWGESLIGFLGIQFGTWIFFLISIILLIGGIVLSISLASIWLGVALFVLWLAGIMIFSFVINVASQVYKGALFIYATEGVVLEPFTPEHMNMAWKTKREKKKKRWF